MNKRCGCDIQKVLFNLVEGNEKGKTKITPLTSAFSINNVTYIREIGDTNIKYVSIDSQADCHHCVFMKYDDFVNERFYQYMKWIKKCPGCTNKQFNDLVYDLIQKACKDEAEIFPRQGFIKINDNDYVFGSFPENMPNYSEIMSNSVKMKRIAPIYRAPHEIIHRWLDLYSAHPTLKAIGLISLASKLKFILEENGMIFKPLLVVSPSVGVNEEKLTAMGIITKSPKNATSYRTVKLPEFVFDLLREYQAYWNKLRNDMLDRWEHFITITLADGSTQTVRNDRLFIKDDTTPMNPDSLTDWTSNFVKRNKLPHFTPHSLRHTHATLLIAEGVSIPTVSRRLGHSSITTTSKIYVHAIQSADEIASDVIDGKLNPIRHDDDKEEAK